MNQKHTMEAENHGESWHRPLRFTYFLLSLLFLFMKHANGQSPTGQPSNEPTAQPSGMKKANLSLNNHQLKNVSLYCFFLPSITLCRSTYHTTFSTTKLTTKLTTKRSANDVSFWPAFKVCMFRCFIV